MQFTVVFGLEEQDNRNKAQGHITGKYGKKGRTSKRDFLGVPKKKEEELLREAIGSQISTNLDLTSDLFDDLATSIASLISVGDEDA